MKLWRTKEGKWLVWRPNRLQYWAVVTVIGVALGCFIYWNQWMQWERLWQ